MSKPKKSEEEEEEFLSKRDQCYYQLVQNN
jgi:hypothetical protein